ncbi:hypothetical protein [Fusobacterium sp. MFO224]
MQYINQISNRLVKWFTMIFLFPLVLVGLVLRIYDKYNNKKSHYD